MRLKKLQEKVKEQQEKVFLVFGKNLLLILNSTISVLVDLLLQ